MLSYKAPFLSSGNLTIFKDDVNDDIYYYLCVQPSISRNEDGNPQMEAYAILPESGIGATGEGIIEASLMIDISLKASTKDLEMAEVAIKEKFGEKPKLLAPAPIYSGKVYLIMAQAGEKPDPKTWFITPEIKPSIFGENRASLVVRAKGEEAKLLIAALNSDVVAASVHYELEMLGIAPVFKGSLVADMKKIYHHFEKVENSNFIFYNDQVSNTIDELAETSAIQIHMEELDVDVKSEALKNMLNELKAEVVKKIFNPASSPLSAANKWEDRIANGAARVLSSIGAGVHYIRRNVDETQLVDITIDLSQRNVKKYPFFPQSLLSSMIKRAGGIGDKIKWIKLDEIPFIDQKVEIRLSADTFKTSNMKSVIIDCRVVTIDDGKLITQQSIAFEGESIQNHFNFTRQKDKTYRYDFKSTMFLSTESNKLPNKLEVDWIEEKNPYIYFNAAEYFETYDLDVNIDDTSVFDHAHLIQADVIVSDKEDGEEILRRTFLFKAEDKEHKTISIVSNRNIPLRFTVNLTYFISESKEHTSSFDEIQNQYFFIPNPFENKWSVDLVCHADWELNSKIILETRVQDAERADPIFKKFDFFAESVEQKLSLATSLSTAKETLEYRVTVLGKNANLIQGPWKVHEGPILVINDHVIAERILRATLLDAPNFDDLEIKNVSIQVKYEDKANAINIESDLLTIGNLGDTLSFTHAMPDQSQKEYQYRIKVRGRNGQSYKTDWAKSTKEKLEIIVPKDIW